MFAVVVVEIYAIAQDTDWKVIQVPSTPSKTNVHPDSQANKFSTRIRPMSILRFMKGVVHLRFGQVTVGIAFRDGTCVDLFTQLSF